MGVLIDILYEDQSNFDMDDFYQLARNMSRFYPNRLTTELCSKLCILAEPEL